MVTPWLALLQKLRYCSSGDKPGEIPTSRQLDQTDMSSEVRRQDEDFGGEEIETTESDLQQTMLGRKCPTIE